MHAKMVFITISYSADMESTASIFPEFRKRIEQFSSTEQENIQFKAQFLLTKDVQRSLSLIIRGTNFKSDYNTCVLTQLVLGMPMSPSSTELFIITGIHT